jgi:hypothetical protein
MSPRVVGKKDPWKKLPHGRFTGIDWSDPQSFSRSDPYLAWAETSGFTGFRSPQGQSATPEWLPLLIELKEPFGVKELIQRADPEWLLIPSVYQTLGSALRVCTARAKRGFFDAMGADGVLHGLVERYELGLPVGHHAKALTSAASPSENTSPSPETQLHGDVIVVIDNGLALAHTDFLTGRAKKKTRVAAFWRQDEFVGPHGRAAASLKPIPLDNARTGHPPSDMGYGHQLTESMIEADIANYTKAGRVDVGTQPPHPSRDPRHQPARRASPLHPDHRHRRHPPPLAARQRPGKPGAPVDRPTRLGQRRGQLWRRLERQRA